MGHRAECEEKLAMTMAGKAAEIIKYGEANVSNGPAGDIQQASGLARAMVLRWGMSEKVGNIDYAEAHEGYSGNTAGLSVSAKTKELIEVEVKRFIQEAYDRAYKILSKKKKEWDRLAQGLLEYETLTGDEIKRVIKGDADFTIDIASTWTDKLATNIDLTAVTWKEPKTTDDSIRGADAEGRNPETKEDRVAPYKRRNTEYPYNRSFETESGHIVEYDDTPYAERIYQKHKSGTFTEIDADGNKVTRVVGQNYEIVAGNNFCNIKGDVNLTIDSNCKTYIKGDWDIQVDGNKNEVVKGNVTESFGTNVVLNTHSTTLTGFRTKTIL